MTTYFFNFLNLVTFHLLVLATFWSPILPPLIMVALWNRVDHYIFMLWFLSSFFSAPNLSGRTLDVYHTSTHGVALVRI